MQRRTAGISTRAASRLVALALTTSLALPIIATPLAFAEPSTAELTAARELFEQGLKLEEKNEWQPALDRFRKVAAIKATPAVRFHMGLCLENLGKLVDALNEFERAQSETFSDASAGAQTIAKSSQKHIEELRERVPRVTIQIPEADLADSDKSKIAITIDSSSVSTAVVGTAIPLDPGSHTIRVTATGKVPFEKKLDLVEKGAPTIVDVVLVAAPPEALTEPVAPPTNDAKSTTVVTKGGPGPWPWVLGGVGIVAFAGAGIMYAKRSSTISELDDSCGNDRSKCPQSKSDVASSGKTYTTVGNVLLGVGGAAVVTAVVLFILSPSSSSSSVGSESKASLKPPSIGIGSGPTPIGIGVQGAF